MYSIGVICLSGTYSQKFAAVNKLITKGEYEEALQIVEKIEKNKKISNKDQIRCIISKSNILNKLGRYDQALLHSESAFQKSKKKDFPLFTLDATIAKAYSLWRLGKLDESLETISKNEHILLKINQKKSKKISKRKAGLRRIQGVVFHTKGELEEALEYYQESLELYKEVDEKQEISSILNNLGVLCRNKGDLYTALKYYEESLEIYQEIGNKDDIAASFNNIGNIYRFQGELDQALEFYKDSLKIWEGVGNIQYIALVFTNIAEIYQQKGDFETSYIYLKKGLKLREQIGNKQEIAMSLYYLISESLDADYKDRALRYLDRLKEINNLNENPFLNQLNKVAQAEILKKSTRMRDKAKAQDLLQEVVEDEISDHSLTITALIGLCELLLDELKISCDQDVLTLLQSIVASLLEIAQYQDSHDLLAKTYWFQSQLALVDLELDKAKELLEKAQRIAEEKGLRRLAMHISSDHDALLDQLKQWEEYITKSVSLKDRLEFAQLGELVVRLMKRGEIDIPQILCEEPVMLLILAESGTPLFSKNYLEGSELDGILIGGFLAAIISFSKETFSTEGSVERIKHQEYTLLLKPKKPFLFCYVIKGQTYSALQKLEAFTKIISTSTSAWNDLISSIRTSKALNPASRVMVDEISKMIFPSKL